MTSKKKATKEKPFICEARQFSDQMVCEHCRTVWDVNDPQPPACKREDRVSFEVKQL